MKIGYLITARMKSTRLPKKITRSILGKEIIRWMIDRIKLAGKIDDIIICTSKNEQDNILEDIAHAENIKCFRGHEEDVLLRLYNASVNFNLDYALNITADCPLVSYEYIDTIIEEYLSIDADLIQCLDLPHGLFSYGIKLNTLKEVCVNKERQSTEVWGNLFTENPNYKIVDLKIPEYLRRDKYRLTLDYPDDLKFFEAVFQNFGKSTYKIKDKELIDYLDNNSEVVEINSYLKKAYLQRWTNQGKGST